jgi:hypothetical protein
MSPKREPPAIDEQGRAFIEKARELGCDEDEERFKESLRRVAGAKPRPELPLKPPAAKRRPGNRKPPR